MTTPSQDLHIGKSGRTRFHLPIELAVQTTAIHGIRGSGKTYTASNVVEELLEHGVQVVIIDPTDVWWGLKSKASGTQAGYPIIVMGGHHGDIPLQPHMGTVLADFVVDRNASVILSVVHMRKAERQRFVKDFAEQLFHRKGEVEHRTPLTLVIDEASRFVPQMVQRGEVLPALVGAIEDIVIQGRAFGLGCILIDQRPARVNKNVLTQLEVLICHRITSPQDRKALREWFEQKDPEGKTAEFLDQLAGLESGRAWVWSPLLRIFEHVAIRKRRTFDSSRTPKVGETPERPAKVAEIDLDALRAELKDTIEEAERNDPKVLHGRIRDLETELAAAPGAIDTEAYEAAVQGGYERGRQEALEEACTIGIEALEWMATRVGDALKDAAATKDQLSQMKGRGEAAENGGTELYMRPRAALVPPERRPKRPVEYVASSPRPAPRQNGPGEGITKPMQKIMDALATYEALGVMQPDRHALAAMAGYKVSGHFQNTVGSMRTAGLVDYPAGNHVELTTLGRSHAQALEVRTTGDVHGIWFAILKAPQKKLLEVLIGEYPNPIHRTALAVMSGYEMSGHFQNIVGSLRTMGAIEYPESGYVRAHDRLFPEIRR